MCTMDMTMNAIPTAAIEVLMREAGDILRHVPDHVRNNPASKEGSGNFVTAYDVKVQAFLKDGLGNLMPHARFFAEEDGESRTTFGAGDVFVIDPIDGTVNFMCGYNTSAISVGLVRDGRPVFGAVYDPYRDEFYCGVTGAGATCNGHPIRVSSRSLDRGIVAIGSAPYRKADLLGVVVDMTAALYATFADFRRSGSAALDLCHVAAGELDAFCEPVLSPWDFAAGLVILQEAGGVATAFDGRDLCLTDPCSCVFGSPTAHPAALGACRSLAASVPLPPR